MSAQIETMAYAGELPWHGLGNKVNADVTIDEMTVQAGLNWTVEPCDMFAKIGDEMIKVSQRKAMVRSTDHKVLTVTGPNWKPYQPKKVLEFFRDYTRAGGATLETAGSLRGGKMIWGLARLEKSFSVTTGDEVKGFLLLSSSYQVGVANTAKVTSVRVVCANTMALALGAGASNGSTYVQNHLTDFDEGAAKQAIALANEEFMAQEVAAKRLAHLALTWEDSVSILAKFVQPEIKPELLLADPTNMNGKLRGILSSVLQAPGATPDNAWGLLNGVTHWADHVAGRDPAARLANAWYGANANLKEAVQDELLKMAA